MQSIETETEDLKKKFYKEYNELKEAIERKLFDIRTAKNTRQITDEEKKRRRKTLERTCRCRSCINDRIKRYRKIFEVVLRL